MCGCVGCAAPSETTSEAPMLSVRSCVCLILFLRRTQRLTHSEGSGRATFPGFFGYLLSCEELLLPPQHLMKWCSAALSRMIIIPGMLFPGRFLELFSDNNNNNNNNVLQKVHFAAKTQQGWNWTSTCSCADNQESVRIRRNNPEIPAKKVKKAKQMSSVCKTCCDFSCTLLICSISRTPCDHHSCSELFPADMTVMQRADCLSEAAVSLQRGRLSDWVIERSCERTRRWTT